MTSKEKLDFILNNLIFPDCINKEKQQEVFKAMDAVEEELEILEAIKNKAQNNRFFKGCLLRMFCETKKTPNGMNKEKIKDENYDKITRWLDEKSD